LGVLEKIRREAKEGLASHLFIVGDLFDSWFEFRSVIPRRHFRTIAAISHIAELIPVDYLMGNHDFGHRDFFTTELGVTIHREDLSRELLGKRFFIAHGDGKAKNDRAYLVLRSILRNRVSLFLYGLIHPDLGIPFAERVSGSSRVYTDQRDALQKQDGMKEFAEGLIAQGAYDFVVMGHRHKPEIARFPSGTYVNLGDWLHHFTYGMFDGTAFHILAAEDLSDRPVLSSNEEPIRTTHGVRVGE
jgi:UDP-2,3-diacylglucosamine hydrolase